MSLVRTACSRLRPTNSILRRNASTADHSHHEDHHHHDSTVYPKEGFTGGVWQKTILFSLLAVGFYKYAPEPAEDVYLTRWIAMYTPSPQRWLELNARHTAQQQVVADTSLLLMDAQKPKVHRYRYPQALDQASPFLRPIGGEVDMSGVVAKGDKDI
ncbi:hypothetical protein BDN72DRAFT_832145 [Pluteus cervinus]|uniref:Uncharacterized protein n=1 Tax=Pluteus cervinus TaxID=181527 RepID=A0ACD3BBS7_9AGAR|nr:hypothetical protein BDN72DRAFT_832145 [Pluteus cervinus]